jgi:hypothetical protein
MKEDLLKKPKWHISKQPKCHFGILNITNYAILAKENDPGYGPSSTRLLLIMRVDERPQARRVEQGAVIAGCPHEQSNAGKREMTRRFFFIKAPSIFLSRFAP